MYKWTINVFEGNGKLKKEFVSDRDAKQARSI